jgi:CO/xanthine dehydrogenase Mo-binding subunit
MAANIANAVDRAVGVRIRQAPLTPERVWRALKAKMVQGSKVQEFKDK